VTITPKDVLDDIWAKLNRSSDAQTLRGIRKTLDEPAFFSELNEYLRGLNDPATKAEVLTTLVDIHRHCGDKSAERKNRLTNVRYGIGGGIALGGASIIAIATLGPVAIIPLCAGGWITFVCAKNTVPISEQEQLYLDITARTAKFREKFDA
jgi:hypothetical protein